MKASTIFSTVVLLFSAGQASAAVVCSGVPSNCPGRVEAGATEFRANCNGVCPGSTRATSCAFSGFANIYCY